MRLKSILLFFLLTGPSAVLAGQNEPVQVYEQLKALSARSLNIATPQLDDSLLLISRQAESLARITGDIATELKAGQIEVNTHGLMGNYGLASSKAQQLLERARQNGNPLAQALAIQALGDTYMHTNQFEQADSLFTEAAHIIDRLGEPYMRVQLHLQRINVYQNLSDLERMEKALEQLPSMLSIDSLGPELENYLFLHDFYRATYALQTRDMQQVQELMPQLRQKKPKDGLYDTWIYFLMTYYHARTNELETALAYSDSTMLDKYSRTNLTNLQDFLKTRTYLLERMGRNDEACRLYMEIQRLGDSLYKSSYIAQIDTLHMAYWTDHFQMAAIAQRNKMYARLIGGLLGLVLIGVTTGLFVRRRNRRLIASREKLEQLRKTSSDSIHTKSLFLSNMSHELRTPLNAIVGFSTLLADNEDLDDETRQQCSDFIRQNADLLMKLISDVVDFSELQGTAISFAYAPCDVVALCRNVISTIDNVKRTDARVEFATDLEELKLITDKNRLQQVLINLLINATKFTKQGTITLRLTTDTEHNQAVFMVEDTGCGIPLDKQPHIFERFEKLHEGIQGAGLGLSICKLIVEHTGGSIWIDSGYTAGARFIFTHPLHYTSKENPA